MKEETLRKLIKNELERHQITNEDLLNSIMNIFALYEEDSKGIKNTFSINPKDVDHYIKEFRKNEGPICRPGSYPKKDYESCPCNPKNGGSGICNCVQDNGIRF